jgi:phospholipid/cholesterol/gamma-HCH transport system permease protein
MKLALSASENSNNRKRPRPLWLTHVGLRLTAWWADCLITLKFIGEVLLAAAHLAHGKTAMRRTDLLWQLDQAGPRSVGIVCLVSGLVGVILAYMGAVQLQRFGAQSYIADLVSIGTVREVAALMTGVILSGRIGAAFAAQLGSMQANEEIDALRALGVDPVEHLVLPRVLAMLIVAPVLTAFAALAAMLCGWGVAVAIFGIAPYEYLFKSLQSLTLPHVLIGLAKGTSYCLLVALAGCRQGLCAGRSAQEVGNAVTASVVQAIVWIVVAASASTIAFQRLDW